jgi:RNA polymerase sigma-B factor
VETMTSQIDVIARLDEQALLRRYHLDGDRQARQELVERLLPLVRTIARRYQHRGEPLEDLVQVGCIGLMKAVDRFDLERGVKLSTFAVPNIAGEIKRYFRDRSSAMRIPRDVQDLSAEIGTATERLTARLQRTPRISEIAEAVGADIELVMEALHSVHAHRAMSLDEPLGDDDEHSERIGSPDENFDLADTRLLLESCGHVLDERDRAILRMRFAQDLTQSEIAEHIGVSQMQVSRLIRRSLKRMRNAIQTQGEPVLPA